MRPTRCHAATRSHSAPSSATVRRTVGSTPIAAASGQSTTPRRPSYSIGGSSPGFSRASRTAYPKFPVRSEVRENRYTFYAERSEDSWPLPQTRWMDLYLSTDGRLVDAPVAEPGTVCFDAGRDEPAHLGELDSATNKHCARFAFRPVQSIGASEIP